MLLLPTPTPLEAASINVFSKSQDWKHMVEYFERALREVDTKLRTCSPDQLGKMQGSAITISDLVALPDAARDVLRKPT